MQPDYVKRRVEREIVDTMKKYPGGRDTRKLISEVLGNLQKTYPSLNRYHVAGMLAWIVFGKMKVSQKVSKKLAPQMA